MGCFSTCFRTSKRSRRSRRPIQTIPSLLDRLQKDESVEDLQVAHLVEEENNEKPTQLSPESNDEKREKANLSERKKVTFDLNVKIYEGLPMEEEEEEEEEEEVTGDNSGGINEEERKEDQKKEGRVSESHSPSDSSSSSLFSYPPNHRYQNCRDSDDELLSEDESLDDYTDDDDDGNYDDDDQGESEINNGKLAMNAQDQSSESLFSLSLNSRKQNLGTENEDKEVNSPIPIKNTPPNESNPRFDQRKYVDSVLNPVENLDQWKVIKARSKQASKDNQHQAKENLNSAQDFMFPVIKQPLEKEITVDTSLSSWLVGSQTTPNSKTSSISVGNSPIDRKTNSPKIFEDRPILGALTVEEIRQISASSSPRKSPSRSPDDMPIIGTVGSYWSSTGLTNNESGSSTRSTKSRFAENTKVIWDSTPFETRLEKALEKESIAEQVKLV